MTVTSDGSGYDVEGTKQLPAYHPSEPEAGLAGGAQGDVGGRHVRRSRQGLDLPRGLTGRTCAHDVHLAHTEPVVWS